MTILLIVEHNNGNISANIRNIVTAATKIGGEIHALVAGKDVNGVAEQAAKVSGIAKVLVADNDNLKNHLAENLSGLIAGIASSYSHIIAPASTYGKDFMPRVAALIDSQQISDIIEVIDGSTFKRPIYAGNAIATVKSAEKTKVITVRVSNFDKAQDGGAAAIETLNANIADTGLTEFVSIEETKSDRPELTSARIVVSGGRGVGSKENFKIIENFADKLGAAVGASRAAVDSGFVPNDYQVGQTGKIVAPELYIAIGISGAIQHLAGMKDSKTIVAINKDENAPIFEVADYGLVGDLFQIIPEIESKLN